MEELKLNEVVESLGEESLAENQEQAPEATEQPVESESKESEETLETAGDEESEDRPKKKGGFQRKIEALEREKFESGRQIAELQQALQNLQQQQVQQPTQTNDMPTLASVGYDEEAYHVAIQDWHQKQMAGLQDQQQRQVEQQRQQAEIARQQQLLQERMLQGSQKYEDFVTKVNDPSLPALDRVNPLAFQTLLESDSGADIAYYLASNPTELYNLASMNPVQTIREVTLLEAKLKAAPTKQVKVPSKPPSTVSGGSSEAVKDPDKMTADEWRDWRNAQLSKR